MIIAMLVLRARVFGKPYFSLFNDISVRCSTIPKTCLMITLKWINGFNLSEPHTGESPMHFRLVDHAQTTTEKTENSPALPYSFRVVDYATVK